MVKNKPIYHARISKSMAISKFNGYVSSDLSSERGKSVYLWPKGKPKEQLFHSRWTKQNEHQVEDKQTADEKWQSQ